MKGGRRSRWLPLSLLALFAAVEFATQYLFIATNFAEITGIPDAALHFIEVRPTQRCFFTNPVELSPPNKIVLNTSSKKIIQVGGQKQFMALGYLRILDHVAGWSMLWLLLE